MAPDYRQGAVPLPLDSHLARLLEKLQRQHGEAELDRLAFRSLGCEYVWARELSEDVSELPGTWLVLIRFGQVLESLFGLSREVAVVYTPFRDLQPRTLRAAEGALSLVGREVTPDLFLVSGPDPFQDRKLLSWSTPNKTYIGLPRGVPAVQMRQAAMLRALYERLAARDVFAETTPVTGDSFFGRSQLLDELRGALDRFEARGIFGLRKTGKTSVLKQLEADSLSKPSVVFILVDLENLPQDPERAIPELVRRLASDTWRAFQARGLRTAAFADFGDRTDIEGFRIMVVQAIEKNPELCLYFALDEIEYLCPAVEPDDITPGHLLVPQFLASLRSVAQEERRFSFLLSGLASGVVENGTLMGLTNPLFAWAESRYVGPFGRADADDMLVTLGRKVAVEWQTSALASAYDLTGGHPFLHRRLASAVVGKLPLDIGRHRLVTRAHVQTVAKTWAREVAFYGDDVRRRLGIDYPETYDVLEFLGADPAAGEDLDKAYPAAMNQLVNLGFVTDGDDGIVPSTFTRRQIWRDFS